MAQFWHFFGMVERVSFLYAQIYIKDGNHMREKLEKLLKDENLKDIPIIYIVRVLIALESYDV